MEDFDVNHLFFWDPFALEDTPFAINRVVVLMWVAGLLCSLFFLIGARRGALVPRGLQNLAETAYLFVRNNIAIDVIGPKEGVKYANYLATLFYFIFFSNLLEIVPGINFPVTSRMAIPAALAFLTWVIFNVIGIAKQGVYRYFKDTLFPPGVPKAIYILLTPIEFFSVFIIRPFTLAVRLFANMVAGHTLLTIFFLFTNDFLRENLGPAAPFGVVTLLISCVLIVFELLVISLQAYIFTMLTAFYIAEAIHGHGEADTEAEAQRTTEHETEGVAA
jgi:F-type H+-transporting ATPase subunit a